MSQWERFPNPPIVEALLDVQVVFPTPVEPVRLEALHKDLCDRYPTKEARVKWAGEIQIRPETVQQALERGPQGFMFKSPDGQRTVQVRQDGYTFNWLRLYHDWEAFRTEAREHWERYRDLLGPGEVTRLGLRYINRLELPLPFKDFREYVTTAPDVASGLPQALSALFMRLEIPDPSRGLLAIITETFQPTIDEGRRLPLIFDIDIVSEANRTPTDPQIWETFEHMRAFKNEIFFASVTERAKELFR